MKGVKMNRFQLENTSLVISDYCISYVAYDIDVGLSGNCITYTLTYHISTMK